MAVFLPWASSWSNLPEELDTRSESLTELWDGNSTWMNWAKTTLDGVLLNGRSGGCSSEVALLYCIYHAKKRAATPHVKVPPLLPSCSSWGHSPCVRPAGLNRWGNLEVAKDVYHGWYQVVLSILPCQCQDQLMGDLHNELDQWLWRAGLYSTTSSGRSLSRGRTCSHAPQWVWSSSWAWSPSSETHRWEGNTAPQHHGCSTVYPSWSPSTGSMWSQEHFHASLRIKGWPPHAHQ